MGRRRKGGRGDEEIDGWEEEGGKRGWGDRWVGGGRREEGMGKYMGGRGKGGRGDGEIDGWEGEGGKSGWADKQLFYELTIQKLKTHFIQRSSGFLHNLWV